MQPILKSLNKDYSDPSIRIRKTASRSPQKPSSKRYLTPLKSNQTFSTLPRSISLMSQFSQDLYEAKCRDLQIPSQLDQKTRFSSVFISNLLQRKLTLQDSKIGSDTCSVLLKFLHRSQISYVDLSKNKLGDANLVLICQALLRSLSIVHIDLSSTDLSQSGAVQVLDLLSKHLSLYSLDLSSHQFILRNKIGQCESLIKLMRHPTLTYLNLSGTALGNEGLKYLIIGIEHNQVMYHINLNSNYIKGGIVKELAQVLITTKVSEVLLAGNQLEDVATEELSNFLAGVYGCGVLTKLVLSNNLITNLSCYKIFDSLVKENYLEHLNLEGNDLTGDIEVVERFLANNKRLKSLNLTSCNIRGEGFAQLCYGLGKNTSLQILILNGNNCKDYGAISMAKALKTNNSLLKLEMSGNKIHNNGGIALTEALKINKSLKVLNLSDNELKDEVGEAFFYIFGHNYSLVALFLHLNPISARYPQDIKKYLERNKEADERKTVQKIKEFKKKITENQSNHEEIERKTFENLAEKKHLEKKIGNYMKKLTGIKQEQDTKLEELKEELKILKSVNIDLSKNLNSLMFEIKQTSNTQEKKIDIFEEQIQDINKSLSVLEEYKKSLSFAILEKKTKFGSILKELEQDFKEAKQFKTFTQKTLDLARNQKAKLENPEVVGMRTARTGVSTKYLSSEKLRKITKSKSPLQSTTRSFK